MGKHQAEDKTFSREKRGRTSESDTAPKKKAKSEDVDLLDVPSEGDDSFYETRMDQAKVINVPKAKKDQFKAKLHEIFMSEHAQVRSDFFM